MLEKLKDKKVGIYGAGKIQQDFQYMFDQIKVDFYIGTKKKNLTDQTEVYKDITQVPYPKSEWVLIICEHKNNSDIEVLFKQADLIHGINYFWAWEFFSELDVQDDRLQLAWINDIFHTPVALWGTGCACHNFENETAELFEPLNVEFYIDNNPSKCSAMLNGKQIRYGVELTKKELQGIPVVVTSTHYEEIKKQLINLGLKEYDDFIYYDDLLEKMVKPSNLLYKTVYDESIAGADCNYPFEYAVINKNTLYCCCPGWVKLALGNPMKQNVNNIWHSNIAKIFRLSVINKTFSFCKSELCPYINNPVQKKEDRMKQVPDVANVPKRIDINIDQSCNLSCPSCRCEVLVSKGQELEEGYVLADQIMDSQWLEKAEHLTMAGFGEVFFSKVYEKMLSATNQLQRNSILILSNGNLFNEKNWNKIKDSYKKISVSVSVDAATPETYQKLRRGGNWETLLKNFQMISDLRKIGKIERMEIRMVVQRENYQEMPEFVRMAKKFGFDAAVFIRMQNWGTYSDVEFREISMTKENGELAEELCVVLGDEIFRDAVADMTQFQKYGY